MNGENRNAVVRWTSRGDEWAILNVDGSYKEGEPNAGVGGVLRDGKGKWLGGFMAKHNNSNVDENELWAVARGLEST